MSFPVSVSLSVSLSLSLFFYHSASLFIPACLSVFLSVFMCVYLAPWLFVCLYGSVSLSVCMYVCMSVCLSVCLSVSLVELFSCHPLERADPNTLTRDRPSSVLRYRRIICFPDDDLYPVGYITLIYHRQQQKAHTPHLQTHTRRHTRTNQIK